ncbi:VWA domain-containing protein [Marinobacter xestospongiae]|uniref:VWA domain-containing protein n=1 Tax=Marinobacter xestospongiae TaxID=994319 RepID=UPI0020030732|nr:VWA domain-containing protein [Marinobacter xestospongiae]MCK7566595.1 VWA domain-containing protein [Marinobacter xestospongiae]
MTDFHLLRPLWLLLLLAIPLLPWLQRAMVSRDSGWNRIIPTHLLAPLLSGDDPGQSRLRLWPLALVLVLTAVSLAGPAWREAPTPLQRQDDSLVIVLDLSLSMLATDVKPDRLTQAKRKIRDLLASRDGSLTALVVYAADAHVVAPLTDDRRTIEGMLSSIDPLIMPAAGNRADLGVAKALPLLDNGALGRGRILLMTDDVASQYRSAIIERLEGSPYTLSTLVVGTSEGGPIPLARHGFIRDNGKIVMPTANPQALAELAAATGGDSHTLTLDDQDIRQLQLRSEDSDRWQNSERDLSIERWQDDGYWLLWLIVPLVALGMRRGVLVLAVALVLPGLPRPALALDWADLWQRPEQRAEALIAEDAAAAAEKFKDPGWQAAAQYRAENYADAINTLKDQQDLQSRYNLGNALARNQQLEEALAAYDDVLEADPDHEDARFNRNLVEQLLEQQKQQEQQNGESGQQSPDGNSQSGEQPPQDPSDNESSQGGQSPSDQQGDGQPSGNEEGNQQSRQDSEAGDAEPDDTDADGENSGTENQSGQQGQEQEGTPEGTSTAPAQLQQSPLSQGQEQWLRRVPDDPGGLLRRKFLQQYQQRDTQPDKSDTPW